LRRVVALIDFNFVRAEVAANFGHNGHVSVDSVIFAEDDVPIVLV